MKHITDIPQAGQTAGQFDLIVVGLLAIIVGVLVGSLIVSWLMAVICRTILRFQATTGSCFKAYWMVFAASLVCGLAVGLFQGILFAGVRGKTHELLPLWSVFSAIVLSTIVSVMIYGLKITDSRGRHLGLLRAIALVFVYPVVMFGLSVFLLWALDFVWDLRGLQAPGGLVWLRDLLSEGLGR